MKNDEQWLKRARKLFSEIPDNTWLFCADNKLYLMQYVEGKRVLTSDGGMDQNYIIGSVSGPEIDGGDW